jgi:hypothetical protein
VTLVATGVAPTGAVGAIFYFICGNSTGHAGDVTTISLPYFGILGATPGPNLLIDPTFTGGNWRSVNGGAETLVPTGTDPGVSTVPVGFTWKLYRTFVQGNYTNTLVHWVVEDTVQGGTIITPNYIDVGAAPITGTPPVASTQIPNPSQIDLATEVTGRLSLQYLEGIPLTLVFHRSGALAVTTLDTVWVNEFASLTVTGIRATLGVGSHAASTDVEVELRKGTGAATPTYTDILGAHVPVGFQIGPFRTPGATPPGPLIPGDSLAVDIRQTGGGATPTDRDLTVTVTCIAHYTTSIFL